MQTIDKVMHTNDCHCWWRELESTDAHHPVLEVLILAAQAVNRVRHPGAHPSFRVNTWLEVTD